MWTADKYLGPIGFFRNLDDKEVEEFIKYAFENSPTKDDWSLFHPICRMVWRVRGFVESPQT